MKHLHFLFLVALPVSLLAQPAPVKRTDQPPIILLNGYQLICSATPVNSTDTFGRLEALLVETGREVRFFDNCMQGRVPIEVLGTKLGEYLSALRYEDGSPVEQVDLIGHSMGGLIARCYLSGRQEDGTYKPPFPKRVRKLITIGSPHFGAEFAGDAPDLQAAAMVPGTRFLYELATWNQLREDLRGVDALAIAGRSRDRAGDGLVSALSASKYFVTGVGPDRTRVISGCHTTGFGGLLLSCTLGERGIANINNNTHPSWQLITSFLSDDAPTLQDLFSAAEDTELSSQAALWLTYATAEDTLLSGDAITGQYAGQALKSYPESPALFVSRTPQGEGLIQISANGQPAVPFPVVLERGVRTLPLKEGPSIASIEMASTEDGVFATNGRILASDGRIRILGQNLGGLKEVHLNEDSALAIESAGDTEIVATVPRRDPGIARVTVMTETGKHSVNAFFGPVPARLTLTDRSKASWDAVAGATNYVIWIGTERGKSDILDLQQSIGFDLELPPLPVEKTVYFRLWTQAGGEWGYRDLVLPVPE